jgi:hypothetical protein
MAAEGVKEFRLANPVPYNGPLGRRTGGREERQRRSRGVGSPCRISTTGYDECSNLSCLFLTLGGRWRP